jgi:hypothetical protein
LLPTRYLVALLTSGALLGLILLNLEVWGITWLGQKLGGRATSGQVRGALAISQIPKLLAAAGWAGYTLSTRLGSTARGLIPPAGSILGTSHRPLAWAAELIAMIVSVGILVVLLRKAQGLSAIVALGLVQIGLSITAMPVMSLVWIAHCAYQEAIGYRMPGTALWFAIALPISLAWYNMLVWLIPAGPIFLLTNRVPRGLIRFANRNLFAQTSAPQAATPAWLRRVERTFVFPRAIVGLLATSCFVALLMPVMIQMPGRKHRFSHDYPGLWFQLGWNIAHMLMVVAIILHYRANSNRKLKYEILLLAFGIGTISFAVDGMLVLHKEALAKLLALEAEERGSLQAGAVLGFSVRALLVLLLAALIGAWLRPSREDDGFPRSPTRWTRFLYRASAPVPWVMMLGDLLTATGGGIYVFFANCATVLLIIRYFSFEQMMGAPAIFLRSFSDEMTGVTLGHIVLGAATRYAPVVALTHVRQAPEALMPQARAGEVARLFTAPDAGWQEWVKQHLSVCSFVVVDASIGTEGVRWEIEEIRRRLPLRRVVIMARTDHPIELPDDVFVLRYGLGRAEAKKARNSLKAWLRHMDAGTDPPRASDRRREGITPCRLTEIRRASGRWPERREWLGITSCLIGLGSIIVGCFVSLLGYVLLLVFLGSMTSAAGVLAALIGRTTRVRWPLLGFVLCCLGIVTAFIAYCLSLTTDDLRRLSSE